MHFYLSNEELGYYSNEIMKEIRSGKAKAKHLPTEVS